MKHTFAVMLFGVAAMAPAAALADAGTGAHFNNATACINSNGDLIAEFKEAGLGDSQVRYDFFDSCSIEFECLAGGKNIAPGQTFTATNVSNTTNCTPSNGSITSPSATCTVQLSCATASQLKKACSNGKGNFTVQVTSASYSGVTLVDATNSVTAFSGDSFSTPTNSCK